MPSNAKTRRLAARRARARRDSAGAVIFIVAMTLGVLAVMGVYALAATAQDLRAAGNVYRGAQANAVNGYGAVATADYVNYNNADDIINRRMLNPNAALTSSDQNCISTQRNIATTYGDSRTKSCVRIAATELTVPWAGRQTFTTQSLDNASPGVPGIGADVYVELTNPTAAAPPAGFDLNSKLKFVMVTATSIGIVRALGPQGETTMRMGRGRLIVGPLKQ